MEWDETGNAGGWNGSSLRATDILIRSRCPSFFLSFFLSFPSSHNNLLNYFRVSFVLLEEFQYLFLSPFCSPRAVCPLRAVPVPVPVLLVARHPPTARRPSSCPRFARRASSARCAPSQCLSPFRSPRAVCPLRAVPVPLPVSLAAHRLPAARKSVSGPRSSSCYRKPSQPCRYTLLRPHQLFQ